MLQTPKKQVRATGQRQTNNTLIEQGVCTPELPNPWLDECRWRGGYRSFPWLPPPSPYCPGASKTEYGRQYDRACNPGKRQDLGRDMENGSSALNNIGDFVRHDCHVGSSVLRRYG